MKGYKHLTAHDRNKMAKMRKEGATMRQIGAALHVSAATVCRELKRGTYTYMNADYIELTEYIPERSQKRYEANLEAKGPGLKIGNHRDYAEKLEELIVDYDYSPSAALHEIENHPEIYGEFGVRVCRQTLYSYVEKRIFARLTNKDLPFKGSRQKKKTKHIRRMKSAAKGDSIEKRPEEVNTRQEPGHWEMDLVVSCRGGHKCLMALTERVTRQRTVRNKRNSAGELTGKAGTVYDVNVKYKSGGKSKTYSRKGFLTKKDALQHEAEMKAKLTNPAYTPPSAVQRKMTVQEYMTEWIDRHGSANLRPSTEASYRSHMKNHIFPYIGDVFLNQLSPAMLDDMYRQLAEKGLSQSSVKYAHRIMGVSLEHARRYHYISSNPARDILTKFGKQSKTPDPYTVDQMRQLLAVVMGTEWELIVVLGGLYGLRLSEIIGLRWRNVDLAENTFGVVEQLPFNTPANTTVISEMAPVKSSERTLPITPLVRPYFERHLELQKEQKRFAKQSGNLYFDNDLVFAKPNGSPKRRERISANFGQLLRHAEMPHIRFHDLRHTAATNMHQLTGDFYTVGQILGHSLKGIGIQLQLSNNLEAVTAQYVDVRMERKLYVLNIYHEAVLGSSEKT